MYVIATSFLKSNFLLNSNFKQGYSDLSLRRNILKKHILEHQASFVSDPFKKSILILWVKMCVLSF